MRIVTTHFLNPGVGMASEMSRLTSWRGVSDEPAFSSVSIDSNQNKQVI